MASEVRDNPGEDRFEIFDDGELAGFVTYRGRPGLLAFLHTEVDDRFEGKGLGSKLASAALDSARERGLAVLPFCPFVNDYIKRHPEYLDLVPDDRREAFGL